MPVGVKALDPLDDSNSLTDLTRSMHHMQPLPAQSASADSPPLQPAAHGPLVQLMHNITKVTAESATTAEGSATGVRGDDSVEADEAVNHAARVSLAHPQGFEDEADLGGLLSTNEQGLLQHLEGEMLSKHHTQDCMSEGHAHGYSAAEDQGSEVDGWSGPSRHDTIPICSAQDFFKGRG